MTPSCSGPEIARKQPSGSSGSNDTRTVHVINCENCGFAHLHPKPDPKTLGHYYETHFYEKEKPEYLSKMESEESYWLAWYGWRVGLLESKISRAGTLLDVGSSGGFFLEAAKRRGWKVVGIEPSPRAADYSRSRFGHEVLEKGFAEADLKNKKFDAIHCSLVVEHLLEPREFLNWAKSQLNPGGVVCVEFPNEFNPFQKILTGFLRKPNWFVSYPDHVNYFTPASFATLAKSSGLRVIDAVSTFPIESFVLMGEDYIGNDAIGRQCHSRRMQFELNLIRSENGKLLENLYRSNAALGIGRETILLLTV